MHSTDKLSATQKERNQLLKDELLKLIKDTKKTRDQQNPMHKKLDEDRIRELKEKMVLVRRDNPYISYTEKVGGSFSEDADSHDPDFAKIQKEFEQNYMKFQEQ